MKTIIIIIIGLMFSMNTNPNQKKKMEQKHYYCEYCGQQFPSVRALTAGNCTKHPDGSCKGKHKLYEGSEKERYTCKYCGQTFTSIRAMTACNCTKHPNGCSKGKHAPAL